MTCNSLFVNHISVYFRWFLLGRPLLHFPTPMQVAFRRELEYCLIKNVRQQRAGNDQQLASRVAIRQLQVWLLTCAGSISAKKWKIVDGFQHWQGKKGDASTLQSQPPEVRQRAVKKTNTNRIWHKNMFSARQLQCPKVSGFGKDSPPCESYSQWIMSSARDVALARILLKTLVET